MKVHESISWRWGRCWDVYKACWRSARVICTSLRTWGVVHDAVQDVIYLSCVGEIAVNLICFSFVHHRLIVFCLFCMFSIWFLKSVTQQMKWECFKKSFPFIEPKIINVITSMGHIYSTVIKCEEENPGYWALRQSSKIIIILKGNFSLTVSMPY